MLIANPIYDTVFKFLMEDTNVAKRLLSNIIGEEIIELEIKPQEQTAPSNKFLLTVFRLDFKAVIRTKTGELKKVLIELQKSKNAFDIMRFRYYLGSNYSKADEIDGFKTALPILPIYFLGFKLSIPVGILKIGRQYQDASTGEILNTKDDFIENLSHDCFVVQIPSLPLKSQTKLEKMLTVFNQKWIISEDEKWLLNYPSDIDDEDLRLMLKRLALAAESDDMKEKIHIEESFDESMENILREKEHLIKSKEAVIEQKEAVIEQKDKTIDSLTKELEELRNSIRSKEE